MWVGWCEFDLLLGDVHSLKQKRGIVKPIVSALWKGFPVAVSEVDDQDLHRRSRIGVTCVSGDSAKIRDILDRVEDFVAERPEVQLLSAHRGLASSDD